VAGCIIGLSIRATYSCAGTLTTYLLRQLARAYKPAINIFQTVEDRTKVTITAYIQSYTGFRLPPNCMTLNDICARFKVVDSLNVTKMAKYSLVMTPTSIALGTY